MIKYLLQGFMLGLAYVAPIGMQNLYVINTAIDKSKLRAYQVALTTIFFDISLALACFFGIGVLMEKLPVLRLGVLLVGSIAVVYIGVQLITSKVDTRKKVDVNKSMIQVVLTCFLITWANPQALIDGSLLLGGVKATLTPEAGRVFIIGVCVASMSWFLGLTTLVSVFKNSFNDKALKIINVICGLIIIYYGLKLGYSFVQAVI